MKNKLTTTILLVPLTIILWGVFVTAWQAGFLPH